ncbi:alcohol dehydrogenase [Streptomyces violaceusniger]|uniref:2-deoxy-scyllo-inosamine dehydrogenase n=1 Tax=Streptomyces violaceusniger TaxID=68280 RepID=A0A4D4LBQ3_STRVO|nr:NAD-dependent alcohol dehydrogenase [Streptomyces violaceusniger]
MKIYAFEEAGGPARESVVATPEPTGHEVLVRLTHSGVCHTDVHLRDNDTGALPFPIVAGHEMAGEVVATGDAVTGAGVGDVRLVYPWLGCGTCAFCDEGRDDRCSEPRYLGMHRSGGYAEAVLVPHERYLLAIDGVDRGWAATLGCSGLTAYAAVAKAVRGEPGTDDEEIVVIGTGGLGLMAIAVLTALGHRRITAVDINDERLEMARGLGAAQVINSSSGPGDARTAIIEATGGGASGVIDLVNSGETARLGFDVLRRDGKLVPVGLFGGDVTLPTGAIPSKRLTVQGSYIGTLAEFTEVVDLARSGRLPRIPVIERPLTAASLTEALDALAEGRVPGRIVLTA